MKIKALALFDTETKKLGIYFHDGEYMISSRKTPKRDRHITLVEIPCTISYVIPKNKKSG